MPKQTITIEVDVPEGYEATGECRLPKKEDWFLDVGVVKCAGNNFSSGLFVILKEIKPWTPPAWMPEGCWLYLFDSRWHISNKEPRDDGLHTGLILSVPNLIEILGYEFNPPTVNKIQIHHTK